MVLFVFLGDDPNKAINPVLTGLFGATAGAASVFGNTPLDVVKTRMQVTLHPTPHTGQCLPTSGTGPHWGSLRLIG